MSDARQKSRSRRIVGVSLLILLGLVTRTRPADAAALPACTEGDISAQDSGCPVGSGPCTISKVFAVGDGCVLDFDTRAVTIAASGEVDIGSGAVFVYAGSFTLAAGAVIDGQGTGAAAPTSHGGMININATGDVLIDRASVKNSRIDVSGTERAGTVLIRAGGSVTVKGKIRAQALTTTTLGGSIKLQADGDVTTVAGSEISASGGSRGGGDIDVTSGGRVVLGEVLFVTGGDGGTVDVTAQADVSTSGIAASATAEYGSGGDLSFVANTGIQIVGPIRADGVQGGCGGSVSVDAGYGDVVVNDLVTAEGSTPEGGGGDIDVTSQTSVRVSATGVLSARSTASDGCGGELSIDARLDLTSLGRLDASGGLGGYSIDLSAGRDITLSGPVRADGRDTGGVGGDVSAAAGTLGAGRLTINDVVDVDGGGCGTLNGCGEGGSTDLSGCVVTVAATGDVSAQGAAGGDNSLTARDQLTINGRVDARASSGGTDGTNSFNYVSGHAPQQAGTVVPAANPKAFPACTSSPALGCLMPCPTCGDGIQQFPEQCDTPGVPQSCDGCSIFCQLEKPSCDDGNPCTIDGCAPSIGCTNESITGCVPGSSSTTTTRPTTSTTTSSTRPSTTTTSTTRPPTTTSTTSTTSSTRPPTTTTSTTTRPPTTTTSSTRPPSTSTSTTTSSTQTTTSSTTSTSASTSTSTTGSPTSTTTLPLPPPCEPADCNDDNPCTDDTCTPGGCQHAAVPAGLPAATCVYQGSALRPAACGGVLPTSVSGPFVQARTLIEKSGTTTNAKKARALVRKALKALRKGSKTIKKATKKHAIDPDCATQLNAGLADALQRALALL